MGEKSEIVRNAIARERRKELEYFQRTLDRQWMNERMEDGRMSRSRALIAREAEMEKDYHERTDHAAIVNAKARREIDMGFEIAKIQREDTNAILRRHYIREKDPSLRELCQKLSAGYVCRDIQQQIRHNEYRKMQEKVDEVQTLNTVNKALFLDQEAVEMEERARCEKLFNYGQELRQQLILREQQKQCQYEDTLIEKKMLDDILRTISDEDKREIKQKRDLMAKTREEMVTFKKAKDAWMEKQKQVVLIEEKEIERQQQAMSDRNAAIVAERRRREEMKDAICQKIADKILADEDARNRRDNIILLLQQQEALEKSINDERAEKEKMERTKRETKETLTAQMTLRKQQEQQERESGARYLQEVIEKTRAEEEKERLKEQKKREKNREHCVLVLKQAEEDRQRHQSEKDDDLARAVAVREYERKWLEEVAEERKKILKEHAPKLIGFLQAGVIKKEDLPIIEEGVRENPELANLDLNALTSSKRPKRYSKCNAQCSVIKNY